MGSSAISATGAAATAAATSLLLLYIYGRFIVFILLSGKRANYAHNLAIMCSIC